MIKHIAYHFRVDIDMKQLFVVPKVEALIELIEAELGRVAATGVR